MKPAISGPVRYIQEYRSNEFLNNCAQPDGRRLRKSCDALVQLQAGDKVTAEVLWRCYDLVCPASRDQHFSTKTTCSPFNRGNCRRHRMEAWPPFAPWFITAVHHHLKPTSWRNCFSRSSDCVHVVGLVVGWRITIHCGDPIRSAHLIESVETIGRINTTTVRDRKRAVFTG